MNMNYVRNGMWYGSRALFVASVALILLTAIEVSGYYASTARIANVVTAAKAKNGHDEDTVNDLLAKGREVANELKKPNMLVTARPKPKPPVCLGIIGSSAIINGKQYKAGDKVGDKEWAAEIISVGTTEVVIKWEDKEMKLIPFSVNNASTSSKKPSSSSGSGKKPKSGSKSTEVKVESTGRSRPQPPHGPGGHGGPEGGRGGFMGMSPEEGQRMRERFRNMSSDERRRTMERWRQFGGERGGSRGRGR